jgi:hypothetical protein
MATLLLGRRWGIAMLALTSGLVAMVFLLNVTGVLPRADDWYRVFDASDPRAAMRLLTVFVACSGIIVFGTSHLLDRAERLLDQKAEALASLQSEVAERERLERTLLTLSLRDPAEGANQVIIAVTDTGEGIAEDLLERIFEPFYTTKDDRARGWACPRCENSYGRKVATSACRANWAAARRSPCLFRWRARACRGCQSER